jgi:hypothetical protein
MIRLIITVILCAVCFAGGYLIGAHKMGPIEKELSSARSVLAGEKTDILQKLEDTRFRLRLSEMAELTSEARSAIAEKNFGDALKSMDALKKTTDSVLGDARDALRKDLTPVVVAIDDIKAGIEKSDSAVKAKLDNLKSMIADIQKKYNS